MISLYDQSLSKFHYGISTNIKEILGGLKFLSIKIVKKVLLRVDIKKIDN